MVEQDPTLKGAVYAGPSKEHPGMPTYYPPDSDIAKLVARFENPKENPLWKMAAFKGVVSSNFNQTSLDWSDGGCWWTRVTPTG